MQTMAIKIKELDKKMAFWILSFFVVLLMSFYFYFIFQSTLNITTYRTIEDKILSLDTKLGEYEFQYIALKNNVDLGLSKTLGFIEASNVRFIDKGLASNAVSLVKNIR